MPTRKTKPSKATRKPRIKPEPEVTLLKLGTPEAPLMGTPNVGQADYDVYWLDGRPQAHVPGLAAEGEHNAVPDQFLPFKGYIAPVSVTIREVNSIQGDNEHALIVGTVRFAITMNGVHVYSAWPRYAATLTQALLEVHEIVQKLQAHEVKWYDQGSWMLRPVWFEGTPAVVTGFNPETGEAVLGAVGGKLFPTPAYARDRMGMTEEQAFVAISILDTGVFWTRTQEVDPPLPVLTMGTVPFEESQDEEQADGV